MISHPISLWSLRKHFVCLIFSLLFILIVVNGKVAANAVTLAWDANNETNLTGYKIYYFSDSSSQLTCDQGDSPIIIPVGQLTNSNAPAFKLTGLTGEHTYYFKMTAVNEFGEESNFSNTVVLKLPIFEVDEILVDHNWKRVDFKKKFNNPVVVAGDLSLNDEAPAVVRIDSVTSTGFEICLQEWDYLDDRHANESVGYIVMEAGSHTLPDGTLVVAGNLNTNATSYFKQVYFDQAFNSSPVICAAVTTFNEADAVTLRMHNINTKGFQLKMQEQEANAQSHESETVSFIAWEPSQGEINGIAFEVDKTPSSVGHSECYLSFEHNYSNIPSFISAMQTYNGGNTATFRWRDKTTDLLYIRLAEEQSLDQETDHIKESLGYMLFGSSN